MLKLKDLSATGHNANGDNVIDYLMNTEALSNYYVGQKGMEEETMRWRGHGAAMLDLLGKPVEKQQMLELAAGYSPDGKKTALCQNAGVLPQKKFKLDRDGQPRLDKNGNPEFVWQGGHQVGYDCTLSAPKSVSYLMAIAPPEERGEILAAHRAAVDQALEYLEGKVETRRGKAGKDFHTVDGLVMTSCDHLCERTNTFSLHTHTLIYGVSYGPDGEWRTFESSELYRHQKAADTVYMSHLAENLRQLGYGIEQDALLDKEQQDTGIRSWRVAGISRETELMFSKRQEEIQQAMETGLSHQQAWQQTRKHKDEPSPDELFANWKETIKGLGQETDIAHYKGRPDIQAPRRSDDDILAALHKSTAVVTEADIQWAVYRARAGESPETLQADVQRFKDTMVHIAPERQAAVDQGEHVSRRYSETRFAWSKIVDWEQEISRRASERKDDQSVRVPKTVLAQAIASYQQERGFNLSDEQSSGLYHLCSESGGYAVLAGVAGSGKTTMSDVFKKAFEANGQHLIGVCVSNKAANKLQEESGMESINIKKMISRLDRGKPLTDSVPALTSKSVVVLDEAGMVPTWEVRELMRHVDAVGAKLLLQGDSKQLQPIGPGSGMSLVSEQLGQAELTEIRRQKHEADRETAVSFYDRDEQGRIILDNRGPKSRHEIHEKSVRIFNRLDQGGYIESFNSRPEAMDGLVRDWLDCPHAIDNRLIQVHDHADSQALTAKLRDGLRERGVLAGPDHTFVGRRDQREYDMSVALGDRVRITKNDNTLGVENGDMCEVEGITRTSKGSLALNLRVEGRHGQPSFAVAVDTEEWNHLQHGYCRTVHDAQGQGKPAVFHFANAKMVDNQSALVAFTRLTSDRYRMYGAEIELEQVRTRLGADRLKQNATQEGLWRARAPVPSAEQQYDQELRRRLDQEVSSGLQM